MAKRAKRRKQPVRPELFLNRELSWLAFNGRVLEEARDPDNRLLERLKFATIVASNLDEFFMVRVASLKQDAAEGEKAPDPAGLTPNQQLRAISQTAHELVADLETTLGKELLPLLAERGIELPEIETLEDEERRWLDGHFESEVLPTLTPLAIDASRPFPLLSNLSLNVAVLLEPVTEADSPRLAVVQVPQGINRLVRIAGPGSRYVLVENLLKTEMDRLFPGQVVRESVVFRIARDAAMELDDEGEADYLEAVQAELKKRRRSRVVRLEIESRVSATLRKHLADRLDVSAADIYPMAGPIDLRALGTLVDHPALEDLREPPLRALPSIDLGERKDLFAAIEEQDILLHHPYESFDPVVGLVSQAAADPDVLAIKQTLYRTSGDSPIVRALGRAADAGKQVTVLFELTARFDEQSNIRWAQRLEEMGAHVIYGIRGYKTHSKVCLIVRRGRDGIRRYVHLGTGNYNDRTARLYTDMGLMTCDARIGEDASAFFNSLTGYSDPPPLHKLCMAPTQLRDRLLKLIERERRRASEGQVGEIRAKMNSLVDEEIIHALYEASRAGVEIKLNVRGVCCLRPGVRGVSETIEVISIVDRFLEHSRIFYFRNGGDEELYLSSADWMPRNLDGRIELMFPVERAGARRRVVKVLDAMFKDDVKAWVQQPDGSYRRAERRRGREPYRVQMELYREVLGAWKRKRKGSGVTLEPLQAPSGASTRRITK